MLIRVLGFALFLAGGAAPATADLRSEELARGWIRSIDAHAQWTAAADLVSSQGPDTFVDGLTISRASPDIAITVGRIRLRDLADRSGGGFAAAEIEASDASAAFSDATATIPAVAVNAVSMPALPALGFEPGQALSYTSKLYSAIALAQLRELAIPEITIVQRTPEEDQAAVVVSATYRNIRLADLGSGVLAGSEAGPITVTTQSGSEASSRFEVGRVDVDRVDIGAIAHVLDETSYRNGQGDGIWRQILGRVSYSGLAASGSDGTSFQLAEILLENAEARQPPRPFVTRLDDLANSPGETPAEGELALETISDVLDAFRLGAFRMQQFAVTSPEPQAGSFNIGAMALAGFSGSGIDSFELRDIAIATPLGGGALKSMEFAGLVFPNYSAFLDILGLDQDTPDQAGRDAAIRKALGGLPKLKRFALAGITASLSEAVKVSLDSLALDLDNYVGPFPASAKLSLVNLRIPGELLRIDPQSAELFDGLGLTNLALSIGASETWDSAAGRANTRFGLAVLDAGDLDLTYSYTGVTEDWLISAIAAAGASPGESDTDAMLKVLDGLGLESARMTVTDRSLLDRAFGYAAAKQNLTLQGPAYREQMRGALPFMLSMAISPELAKLITAPLQSFLAGGQTLIVEARPQAPIPLPALSEAIEKDPLSVPGLLNLAISSEPAPPRP